MKPLHIAAAAVMLGFAGTASAVTINFADLPANTVVSNQFAGVSFSIYGGPGDDGSPLAGYAFGSDGAVELLNSTTNDYPTSTYLSIVFDAPASDVSFRFNNYGTPEGFDIGGVESGLGYVAGSLAGLGAGYSTWTAFDIDDNVIGSAEIGFSVPYQKLFVGSDVKRLVISNGSNGEENWLIGISQLNFNGVPEPGTWAMMILGFGAIGVTMRRRQTAVAA